MIDWMVGTIKATRACISAREVGAPEEVGPHACRILCSIV